MIAERGLQALGYANIAGLDEVGRGCLAGPVVAAAVILPIDDVSAAVLSAVRDSKQLSATQRRELGVHIRDRALAWAIGSADARAIERHNIVGATRQAMQVALAGLAIPPDALLIDALRLPHVLLPQLPLIKGDQRSLSIAAASILAKVARDDLMVALDARHAGYGFARHKGYGTPEHLLALQRLGPCPEHRRTFAPVRALLNLPEQLLLAVTHDPNGDAPSAMPAAAQLLTEIRSAD